MFWDEGDGERGRDIEIDFAIWFRVGSVYKFSNDLECYGIYR